MSMPMLHDHTRSQHTRSQHSQRQTAAGDGADARRPAAVPRVLAVAGSDPSGGAGIQADLKSIAAAHGYGMTAITALTAQNTLGVREVHVPGAEFLSAQLAAVSDDVAIDAVKIGMLASREVVEVVARWLDELPAGPARPAVVLDPVMVATSGDRLLDVEGQDAVRALLPRVDVVTPNLPELAVLVGEPTADRWEDAVAQAGRLASRYQVLVVVKGGHLPGREGAGRVTDALVGPAGVLDEVDGPWVTTTATHGTGCSLSSGLATRYAGTGDWGIALRQTKAWLTEAIRAGAGLGVGHGHGPVDHLVQLRTGAVGTASGQVPAPGEVARALAGQADASEGATDGAALVARWWDDAAGHRAQIDALPFVRGLGDGTLAAAHFRFYLEQDALYLREYARSLARASELAPTRAEQAFWAGGAHGALATELDLHTTWLGGEPHGVEPSPTTAAYLDHLHAAGRDYATLVAAVLPCYWIYQDAGERLVRRSHDAHPYRQWLATYGDPAFARATREAVAVLERVAGAAGPEQRHRMSGAFDRACRLEVAFFDQAHAWAAGELAG
ncbi:bifunctional hydroxymethylpyrimidine kinase/phosphomethylpyrimidine kinase [Isoptericola sp. NEAU-Y5]|uniref:Bifunctional hydroxymethylpyrimidine kinase/phosphomethylpyrimidine kinase n=1 Tax=Isoptericola luteus TaxID=2879484 RepID=A0ABS7ZLU7_9MICO|nr:bifunctional hydroxymethylpyrimidine kinase/phosphomethylpyrimidine kinase [Isoptericola sp. NEAU-Y5]MCA5894770.1 bifunctional hydroxymethylpyrimidine kinase/phosphomethylpyrimidine kinase [Isoptericola sp. NEAU-Y5]